MKKTIAITPEWILNEMPITHIADGKGNVQIHTIFQFEGSWIKLALQTLGMAYKQLAWHKTDNRFFAQFEFRIADIQEECPALYEKLNAMDEIIRNHENN